MHGEYQAYMGGPQHWWAGAGRRRGGGREGETEGKWMEGDGWREMEGDGGRGRGRGRKGRWREGGREGERERGRLNQHLDGQRALLHLDGLLARGVCTLEPVVKHPALLLELGELLSEAGHGLDVDLLPGLWWELGQHIALEPPDQHLPRQGRKCGRVENWKIGKLD